LTSEEKHELLKSEYLHLQKVIEDFDGRAVTIKAWSISFSLVALVSAFASHAAPILLVASFSALLFWIIESFWKTFQYAYYDRAGDIEEFFRGDKRDLIPLQIGVFWYKRWKSGGMRRLIRIMGWPHVALPHALIFFVGLILFVIVQAKVINI